MDRAYVICHMAVSLDGKIDGDFHEAEKAKKQGHYCLVYDREGRCTWEAPTSAMNGVPMQIVEVVTKAARKEYLAYLRDMGISYLINNFSESQ